MATAGARDGVAVPPRAHPADGTTNRLRRSLVDEADAPAHGRSG